MPSRPDGARRSAPPDGAGRVAVVTGASRGIGAATALCLARDGWDVCVGFRRRADAAAAVVEGCRASGGRAVARAVDVSSEADVVGLFAAADELGPVGALVSNAGIVLPPSRVEDQSREGIEEILAVNVIGPFLCAREGVRRMSTRRGGGGGTIVNVSSIGARLGAPGGHVDYAASKGAVETMTVGLAREVAGEGIRVNGVRPGVVDTDIHPDGDRPPADGRWGIDPALGRSGRPEEVARAIAWLCSGEASYVVGAVLEVTGGAR